MRTLTKFVTTRSWVWQRQIFFALRFGEGQLNFISVIVRFWWFFFHFVVVTAIPKSLREILAPKKNNRKTRWRIFPFYPWFIWFLSGELGEKYPYLAPKTKKKNSKFSKTPRKKNSPFSVFPLRSSWLLSSFLYQGLARRFSKYPYLVPKAKKKEKKNMKRKKCACSFLLYLLVFSIVVAELYRLILRANVKSVRATARHRIIEFNIREQKW